MPTGVRIGTLLPGLGMGCKSKVVRIAAVRRLASRRARRSLQVEARSLVEAHGQHVGYALAVAGRLVKLSVDERQKLAALSDAIECEVGFGWYLPGEAERA